jgi:hypothetical protein
MKRTMKANMCASSSGGIGSPGIGTDSSSSNPRRILPNASGPRGYSHYCSYQLKVVLMFPKQNRLIMVTDMVKHDGDKYPSRIQSNDRRQPSKSSVSQRLWNNHSGYSKTSDYVFWKVLFPVVLREPHKNGNIITSSFFKSLKNI